MATYTNLDDEIFSNSALEGFVSTLAPLRVFSNNFSPMPGEKGDNVLVPLIGALTATTFGGAYNICGGSQSVVTVSINRHKIVHLGQTDLTAAASSKASLESFGFQQGAALAVAVFQDIMSLLTTANFALATAVAVASFGVAQIRKGRLLLNQAKAPINGRVCILDCEPFDTLLGISNFLQVNLAGNDETLRDGKVGRALGADFYETNALPGTNSVMGLIAHPSAIAVAMRYLQPQSPEAYKIARAVADPDTGLVMGLRRHYDPNTGTEYVNLEANYGYTTGITNGGRLFHRTD